MLNNYSKLKMTGTIFITKLMLVLKMSLPINYQIGVMVGFCINIKLVLGASAGVISK